MTVQTDLGQLWKETQRLAARALGEQREPTPYDYREREPWNGYLKRLEPDAGLWTMYKLYHEARLELERLEAKRAEFQAMRRAASERTRQIAAGVIAATEINSDDIEAVERFVLRDQTIAGMMAPLEEQIKEAKVVVHRKGETWFSQWREYEDLKTFIFTAERQRQARGQQSGPADIYASYDPLAEEIAKKRELLARYEASTIERLRLERRAQASDDNRKDRVEE